jgi:DNA-binding Lrp family transcriptional regulator
MDELDAKILSHLEEDGRASYTDIADKLGVSEGTVRNRVQRLRSDGIIKRFTVEIADSERIAAVVMAAVEPSRNIAAIIAEMPPETEVMEVTGDWDLILRFARPTSEDVNEVLERIRKVEGVTETTTYTVLASHQQ